MHVVNSVMNTGRRALLGTLAGAIAISACGCASPWWHAFLDPTQTGNFRENLDQEILDMISFRDHPSGIPHAVDPTPDDLVAIVEVYRIGPGDAVQVQFQDFRFRGDVQEITLLVNELGQIDVPQLGLLDVSGLTSHELRQVLVAESIARGIYAEGSDPLITATLAYRQQRQFSISGTVLTPGQYQIPRPDFRLLEAINVAGGLEENVKTVFVSRNERRETRNGDWAPASDLRSNGAAAAPPVEEPDWGAAFSEGAGASEDSASAELLLPTADLSPHDELVDALQPREQDNTATTADRGNGDKPGPLPPFAFNGQQKTTRGPVDSSDEVVDWEELASEGQQRIIRIPAERLRTFDSSYNIVIRSGDTIHIDPGPVGLYYMGGHVNRPGTYQLNGEEITLTGAVTAAGGLDPLAWPTRCEIRRRIDSGREEITQWDFARIHAGQDPNIYLKPNDEINIGTHAIAPLLATIRNSFRLTYGFGFVYDRNFADIDAYFGQSNPYDRRRAEVNQRFPGLVPFFN